MLVDMSEIIDSLILFFFFHPRADVDTENKGQIGVLGISTAPRVYTYLHFSSSTSPHCSTPLHARVLSP